MYEITFIKAFLGQCKKKKIQKSKINNYWSDLGLLGHMGQS